MTLSPARRIELFRRMLRLRNVELRIESLYHEDRMKTPVHLCIGQEAISVGVCAHLTNDDSVSSNHRSHGHYLAKGGGLNELIAELHCKESGCTKGRGGSMHLVDTAVGHMGSSSIVGGGVPIGTGMALAYKMQRSRRVSVVFFGDGAADEGVLYESVNFAILKRLPVVYIYENNGYSVCTTTSERQGQELIFHQVLPNKMWTQTVDGNSLDAVNAAAATAIALARSGGGPSLIECKTYRVREHAGSGVDRTGKYRDPAEIERWENHDPVHGLRADLLARGLLDQKGLDEMEAVIEAEIDEAFRAALKSPLPLDEDLTRYVFCED